MGCCFAYARLHQNSNFGGLGGREKMYLIKTKELIKKRGSRGRSPLAKF